MSDIHVLDKQTWQSIAAGEVVERPASVIKELCENALDAGADRIQIYIEQGGIKSMRVTDNGIGMTYEDAVLAFADHATSKIKSISDLDQLGTMGFRGEALPTIASVSKVLMETRRIGDGSGTLVRIEGAELLEHAEHHCNEGTTIEVRDLFYNTPARYKFLKKDQTEASRISDVVRDLALSRPDVSFYLESQGKELLHTLGDNQLISAVYAVYGRQLAKSMVPVLPPAAESAVSCEGYLSLPEASRKSRNWQLFFVNNRPIKAPVLTRALEDVYKSTLMSGRFPAAVLKLNLPMNLVDVNVHPRKLEVRFWNESEVYRSVYAQVQNSLFTALRPQRAAVDEEPGSFSDEPLQDEHKDLPENEKAIRPEIKSHDKAVPAPGNESSYPEIKSKPVLHFDLSPFAAAVKEEPKAYEHFPVLDKAAEKDDSENGSEAQTAPAQEGEAEEALQLSFADEDDRPELENESLKALARARFAGQLFRTYLLFEEGDTVFLIDQHAAHEKILFEQAVRDFQANKHIRSQLLLQPETVELSPSESLFVEEHMDLWDSFGFDLDFFGRNKILLRAIPIGPGILEPEKAFRSLMDELADKGLEQIRAGSDIIYHMLATSSCKAAVKAHDDLKPEEINVLREDLLKLNNPYHCPHGRPVIIEIMRKDLEKLFKRIV